MPGALTIRKLRIVALAPGDHPEPESFRIRLEGTVRTSLAAALAEALGEWTGEGILRIRRLEVDLIAGAGSSPDQVTARVARAIADALVRARADGERVFTFADRSDYLAAFLQELAAGRAWQRWWFRSFDGLRMLPLSAAIRTALLADVASGLRALLGLPPGAQAGVLAPLSARDAARVLDALAGLADPGASPAHAVAALIATWSAPGASALLAATPAAALALYLDAVRADPDCSGGWLAALATALTTSSRPSAGRNGAVPTDADGTFGGRGDARNAPALAALSADLRRALLAAATQQAATANRRHDAPAGAAGRRYTPFGGLFILLASLDLAAIAEAIEPIVDVGAAEQSPAPAQLLGFLTLAACAGRARAAQFLADPLWRDLFGLPPALAATDIAVALSCLPNGVWPALTSLGEAVTTRADARFLLFTRRPVPSRAAARAIAGLARAALSRFARRLPGFAGSSAPFLWRNLLAVSAAVDSSDAGLSVVIDRCPLDVLLSISGIADAVVSGPDGTAIRLRRRPA